MTAHDQHPAQTSKEIDVWTVPLDRIDPSACDKAAVLSFEERERVAGYRTQYLRDRATQSFFQSRLILSKYVDLAPDKLTLLRRRFGKPWLLEDPNLYFNSSHSADMYVCAVSRVGELGIDVERLSDVSDAMQITRQFFAPGEVRAFEQMPAEEKMSAFFRCWTRKEAIIKATGEGLQRDLNDFEVSLESVAVAPLIHCDETLGQPSDWEIHSFVPTTGYIGAIAIRDRGTQLRFRGAPSVL
jgi:4'-phosphopantetheinyl transferase